MAAGAAGRRPGVATNPEIDQLAEEGLGIEELHPEQRRAVDTALSGHDVLAVMPTGYGKSAIYQLVGAAVEGATVVVSPLIALQHDQVESLTEDDVGAAVAANSTMPAKERRGAFEEVRHGDAEFLFLAPEQLARPETMETVRTLQPSVFVVDEAHCISSWGHDFRPDYLRLGHIIDELGHPVVIALTATAAPPVRAEIVERLHLRDHVQIVHGFDRPNIRLSVEHPADAREKDGKVLDRATVLAAGHHSGIVYVATRKRTEELAGSLTRRGVRAEAYHAGLRGDRRDEVQERFMAGEVDVVVATTAFGMGIDKPDVRFVLHADAPESLDSYYQEIGRAGRDGREAEAGLFFRRADLGLRRFLGARGGIKPDDLAEVADALSDVSGATAIEDLEEEVDLSRRKVVLALSRLEDDGAVDIEGDVVRPSIDDQGETVQAVAAEEDRRKQVEASRVEMVSGYAEARACRRRFLLGYFGEDYDHDCGRCDNCESGIAARRPAEAEDAPFPHSSRVRHTEFGDGQVVRVEGDVVTVLFDDVGYKTLSAEQSRARDLLSVVR